MTDIETNTNLPTPVSTAIVETPNVRSQGQRVKSVEVETAEALEEALLDAYTTYSMIIPSLGDVITVEGLNDGELFEKFSTWILSPTGTIASENMFELEVVDVTGTDVTGRVVGARGSGNGPFSEWSATRSSAPTDRPLYVGTIFETMAPPAVDATYSTYLDPDKSISERKTIKFDGDGGNYFEVQLTVATPETGYIEGVVTNSVGTDTLDVWVANIFPGSVSGAEPVPEVITKVADSSSTDSTTITAPADIQAGDLIVMFDFVARSTGASVTKVVPTGFTEIVDTELTHFTATQKSRAVVSCKIADGSEASSVITGMVGTAFNGEKAILVFRPDNPATVLTVGGVDEEAGTMTPADQVVPSSGANSDVPVLVVGATYQQVSSPTITMSPAEDGTYTQAGDWQLVAKYKFYDANEAPADVTVSSDGNIDGTILQSFYIELSAQGSKPGNIVIFQPGPVDPNTATYPTGDGRLIDLSENPTVGAAEYLVASGSLAGVVGATGVAISLDNVPANCKNLMIRFDGISHNAGAAREPLLRASTDGGSTFDSTAANYDGFGQTAIATANLFQFGSVAAAAINTGNLTIMNFRSAYPKTTFGHNNAAAWCGAYLGGPITDLQFSFASSGSFDGTSDYQIIAW